MFEDSINEAVPTSQFLAEFKHGMSLLRPPAPAHHTIPPSYIPKDLATAVSVYVRHDAVRGPLQRPYDGPFRVVRKEPMFFIIDRNGNQESVTIDRLKVAYFDEQANHATSQVSTRSTLSPPTATLLATNLKTTSVRSPSYADVTSSTQIATRSGRTSRPPLRLVL